MPPSLSRQHLGAVFPLQRGSPCPLAGVQGQDFGVSVASVPQHSCLSLPLGQVSGYLVLRTLISRTIQPLWGASSAVPVPAGLQQGGGLWSGGWCRLSFGLLPNLVCPPAAQRQGQSCRGSPHLCSPAFVPLLFLRALHAHPGTSGLRESKGVSASKGGVLVPRPFAKKHPRALEPWAVPGGAVAQSWQHRAGDTTGPPSRGHVFPNHLNPPAFEQNLYHGAAREGGSLGKARSSRGSCARRGERGTWRGRTGRIPTPGVGMTPWAPARWGNKSIPGMFFLYIFVGMGGGRADGRCLRKLFIFNPVESFGLFLVFWPLK